VTPAKLNDLDLVKPKSNKRRNATKPRPEDSLPKRQKQSAPIKIETRHQKSLHGEVKTEVKRETRSMKKHTSKEMIDVQKEFKSPTKVTVSKARPKKTSTSPVTVVDSVAAVDRRVTRSMKN
jgi:hypothetical protein